MNWHLFYLTFGIAFCLSTPTFSLINLLSKTKQHTPKGDSIVWHGRRYSNWKEETTLMIGNPFFFSLMDALIATAFEEINWTVGLTIWASTSIPIGAGVTLAWFIDATCKYRSGEIPSWGWQWCGPEKLSISTYWHTVYFLIHSSAIAAIVIFFSWQDAISIHVKVGMLFAITGYFATFQHFVYIQNRLQKIWDRDR